jgi:AAA ATPase domain
VTKPGWVVGPGSVIARTINGPVTVNVIGGSPDPIRDAIFDPSGLEKALDLAHFTGREWLIRRIDDYIAAADHDHGYIMVQAEAGVGKSALAAHLVWTRLCAHHFTRLTGGQSPVAARRNLAAQLIVGWDLTGELTEHGSFPKSANSPRFLVRVLRQAAQRRNKLYPGAPLVLVVDGLDEAAPPPPGPDGDEQDTGIPLGLPHPDDLPAGVFIVATTRFGLVIPNLADPDSWHEIVVDGSDNLADMHRYLTAAVTGPTAQPTLVKLLDQHQVEPAVFASKLADQCNGVWIYLQYVLDAILRGQRSPADLGSLPANLAKYYLDQIWPWRRLGSWDRAGLPALAALAGLARPVSLPELAGLCLADKESLREWLDGRLRPFLDVTRGPQRQAQYAIRHQSFRDLFTADDGDDTEPWAPQRTALRDAFTDTHTRLAAAHRQAAAEWKTRIGELPEARYETVEHLFRARHHLTFASPWQQAQYQEADAAQITALLLGDPPAADEATAALLTAVLMRYAEDTAEPSLLGLMEFVEEPSFYSGAQVLSYLSHVTDPDRPAHTAAAQIARQIEVDCSTSQEEDAERILGRVREAIRGPLLDVRPELRDPVYLRVADSVGSSSPEQAEQLYREVLATPSATGPGPSR